MKFDDKTSVLDIRSLPKIEEEEDNRSAAFIVLTGSQAGRMYKVDQEEMVIGRGSDALIRIEDDGVSRQHARVRKRGSEVVLEDLESTNGTFCNGKRLRKRELSDGDKVQIGTTTILKFSFQDSIEEDFQRRQYESATRDALTACYNKKYFLERLPNELAFAARHDKRVALAMFDIDHFKKINDTYGHQAGDYVLRELAALVTSQIRTDDVLSRYGGEEFALIMRETNADAAFVVAERVRRRIESTEFLFDGTAIPVTISLGIAVAEGGRNMTTDDLIKAADAYLYKAKNGGRNRTECEALA